MATPSRFELPISSLTGRRVRPLHHGAAKASSRCHAMQTPRKQAATRVKDNAEWRPRQGVAGRDSGHGINGFLEALTPFVDHRRVTPLWLQL